MFNLCKYCSVAGPSIVVWCLVEMCFINIPIYLIVKQATLINRKIMLKPIPGTNLSTKGLTAGWHIHQ